MKKIILSFLVFVLLVLCGLTFLRGVSIFGFRISGIFQIKDKDIALDEKIEEATKLASTDYPNALATIDQDVKKLKEEKANYEELTATNASYNEQGLAVSQLQKYQIEYLWAKAGKHATSEGIEMNMDLVSSGVGENIYDLKFTTRGSYIGIADFISSIENDPELGFKIEEFNMTQGGSTDSLQATFKCKNVEIEGNIKTESTNNAEGKEGAKETTETSATPTEDTSTETNSNQSSTSDE